MNIEEFIADWIAASNAFDTKKYLDKYLEDAVLDDPSVGERFVGHPGIKDYFERYFIGYNTQTKLVKLNINTNQVYLEVEFVGEFPGGRINGTFDMTFKEGKIASAKADLI